MGVGCVLDRGPVNPLSPSMDPARKNGRTGKRTVSESEGADFVQGLLFGNRGGLRKGELSLYIHTLCEGA